MYAIYTDDANANRKLMATLEEAIKAAQTASNYAPAIDTWHEENMPGDTRNQWILRREVGTGNGETRVETIAEVIPQ